MILNPIFPFIIREIHSDDKTNFSTKNFYQFNFIKNGLINFGFVAAKENSIIFIKPDSDIQIHTINNLECLQIIFKPRFFEIMDFSSIEKDIFTELFFKKNGETNKVIILKLTNDISIEIFVLFNKILNEYKHKKYSYHIMIKAYLSELFVILARNDHQIDKSAINNPIDIILDYINDNYADELNLGILSRLVNLNPSYISRIFKEKTGENIFQFINEKRIKKAAYLLKNTKLSIIEISMLVGYNNLSFFNRTFRKIMNTSPKEYRK